MRGVSKRFGEVAAVKGAELTLTRGEIHALLGENGAGKTTLMCMLAGLYRPDAGQIEIDGRPRCLRSPREAMAASIGMVHQHFMLVPALTVAENVLLGSRLPVLLRPRRLLLQVEQTAKRLGLEVPVGAFAGSLSVGEQQRVEILRVLAHSPRVLILDEPTAVLSPVESQHLFSSLRRLADEGCAVVLISHKLEELRRAADRVTVMRRGEIVARFEDPSSRSPLELASAMVGREVSLNLHRAEVPAGPVVLRVAGLRVDSDRGFEAVRGVDLEVRGGEILGLAAVSGNGQAELMEAAAGLRPVSAGTITLGETKLQDRSPRDRAELGLRYIPEDRQHTGTSPSLSVSENLQLRTYRQPPARRGPLLDLSADESRWRARMGALQIESAGMGQPVRLLSGGNLQKVVLARELDPGARVILAMQPTRGLDAWATAEVHRQLLAARERGAAVLLCSTDLDEVLALADRIAVMSAGRVVHQVARAAADLPTIGRFMASRSEEA